MRSKHFIYRLLDSGVSFAASLGALALLGYSIMPTTLDGLRGYTAACLISSLINFHHHREAT